MVRFWGHIVLWAVFIFCSEESAPKICKIILEVPCVCYQYNTIRDTSALSFTHLDIKKTSTKLHEANLEANKKIIVFPKLVDLWYILLD